MKMVLSTINNQVEKYKKFILTAEYDELYKWDALQKGKENWDINATDFKSMYEKSLTSDYSSMQDRLTKKRLQKIEYI